MKHYKIGDTEPLSGRWAITGGDPHHLLYAISDFLLEVAGNLKTGAHEKRH